VVSLASERQSKAYAILRYKGRQVTIDYMHIGHAVTVLGPVASTDGAIVVDCTAHYVTLHKGPPETTDLVFPLNRVNISFDSRHKQLKLEVTPT
jgi:hypothetical protein